MYSEIKMETKSINNLELFEDIELRIGIKYESFISNIKEGHLDDSKRIFKDLVSTKIDNKIKWLNEYYIREVLDQLSASKKAALWLLSDDEANFDIQTIGGSFSVDWTDFVFGESYYDEVLVIEYLKKYIDPFKISAHNEKDLHYVLESCQYR